MPCVKYQIIFIKEKSFHMKLCPVNFWMKVNPHLERNCSVNNVLVFAAVKGALRK